MTTSRTQLLDYLHRHPHATATEISHVLGTTAANVRHHLSVLVEIGVVEVISSRPQSGRGRPSKLYALSSRVHEHNLGGLASTCLTVLLDDQLDERKSEILRQLAIHLAAGIGPGSQPSSLGQRITKAVLRLNALGYKARWEAHSQAPHLVLGHCPYAAILPEHPELCQMDAYLLEQLSGVIIEQRKKQQPDSTGARYCLFLPTNA